MQTVEFYANVQGQVIEIPREYRHVAARTSRARVILFLEPSPSTQTSNLIDQWLAHPLQAPHFRPLTREAIYGR